MWLLFACSAPSSAPAPDAVAPDPVAQEPVPTEVPAPPELAVVDRPLPWDDARTRLTAQYRQIHYGQEDAGITIEPRMIVLHWTVTETADQAWNTFAPTVLGGRPDLGEGTVNVSSQFLVDRDGTIYQLMPPDRMARHTIGLNHVAIGVENVGNADLTEAQVEANIALVRSMAHRFPITHLIGHYEHNDFEDHPYWAELDPTYRTTKIDPGADFMKKVRAGVEDLGLEP